MTQHILFSKEDLEGLGDDLGAKLRAGIDQAVTPLLARIVELEQSAMRYRGVWQVDGAYKRGHCVTDAGGVWFALCDDASGRPGKSSDWKLVVKTNPEPVMR